MLQMGKWKIITIIVVTLLGVLYAAPNVLTKEQQAWLQGRVPDWLPSRTVNLGLDLRGGSYLLYEADMKEVLEKRMKSYKDDARNKLRAENIHYNPPVLRPNGISVKLMDPAKDTDAVKKIMREIEPKGYVDASGDGTVTLTLDDKAINQIKAQIIEQEIEVVRQRVDQSGTKEPLIQRQGSDRIVVQLPGVGDPSHIKKLIGVTGDMSFHLLDEDAANRGQPGINTLAVPMRGRAGVELYLRKEAALEGSKLVDAQQQFDPQSGSPVVTFKFNSAGAKIFCDITRQNTGKPFAVVMDYGPDPKLGGKHREEILTAPNINEPICGGSGQISGGFTVPEATDLALLLRSGALPASLTPVEERSVGPTLGSDSVAAGKTAAIAAFIAVVMLMFASYGLFGLFADIALTFNLCFIFALLSMLQATLTLPGIAGIILTIGIAVDSNVLIYERIREELAAGRSVISSIDKGYDHALRTIIDSNLTTLIVALILFSFGSGPVKGFAVAMCIGIITSLYSSIMITRLIIITWLRKMRPVTLEL